MAVIASQPGSVLNTWYAVIGIGVALTVPPLLSCMMTNMVMSGPQIAANVTALQLEAQTMPTTYDVPQNLGLPNRREPGGTR